MGLPNPGQACCRKQQEVLQRPQEEVEGFSATWSCRHPPGWSSQGKACDRVVPALLRAAPDPGPHKVNGCPLRRVNQRYLLATSTKVDVSGVKIPANIDDKYFARVKQEKSKDGEIFSAKKEEYKASEERKKDQATVDAMVLDALKKHPEGAVLKQYLKASFALSKGEFPHRMTF